VCVSGLWVRFIAPTCFLLKTGWHPLFQGIMMYAAAVRIPSYFQQPLSRFWNKYKHHQNSLASMYLCKGHLSWRDIVEDYWQISLSNNMVIYFSKFATRNFGSALCKSLAFHYT